MLAAGTALGPYKILAPLGVGGMGEVYRAHDTRLGRDVAIQVLPSHLAATPEARARFEREARTISQLNHPHICTLYDVGREGDTDYLVMELLEGETLAHRLEKGPLPVADVLSLGSQIADALDRAHRHGIVHRDLKPGNVMLTKSGAKLMDFGLARAQAPGPVAGRTVESPTLSSPLTSEGTIVGTVQYMAPEQLEGKEADARTDLWALGCVLYETATGKRAFEGPSQASLIAAILKETPRPITELQPLSPPALGHLVRCCLAKEPDSRWQSARDVMHGLEWVTEAGSQAGVPVPVAAQGRIRGRLAWALVAALGIAAAAFGVRQLRQPVVSSPVVAFNLELPGDLRAPISPALSPDGRWLVFAAYDSTNVMRLWLRPMGGHEVRPLAGTEGVDHNAAPFWSPDSRSIAFFLKHEGKLMRMPLEGGSPQALCDAPDPRGGCWGRDDVILFAPGSQGAIFRVPAAGGSPVAVTKVDSTRAESHRYPSFLSDGRRFLYVSLGSDLDRSRTWLASLDGGTPLHVLDATSVGVYAPPGQVLFRRQGVLLAQAFDPVSGRLRGQPRTLVSDVRGNQLGSPDFSISGNGLLVCPTGQSGRERLYWYDRSGCQMSPASGLLPGPGGVWRLSPDGRQVLYSVTFAGGGDQLWLVNLVSGLPTRLVFGNAGANGAFWSPDGRKVYFAARPQGRDEIHSLSLGGMEGEKLVFRPPTLLCSPVTCTPDGAQLVVLFPAQSGNWELWLVPTSGTGPAQCLLRGPFNVGPADVSPDGHRLAYASDESGRYEVYVTSFPVPGVRHRVSSEGGDVPVWSRGGRELLFRSPGRVMAADISTDVESPAGIPHELFRTPEEMRDLTVTGDGNRFLLVLPGEQPPPRRLTMLVNWQHLEAR